MKTRVVAALLLTALAQPARAEDDVVPLSPDEVRERWHGRLDGRRFTARVRLAMQLAGLEEQRVLSVWRADESGSQERVMVRFEAPADLRDVGVLYLEQPGRSNDYFLYQPALRRVRRLPEAIANDDVYGIDLEFLGFGVAQSEPTEVESARTESVEGRPAWRLEERALRSNPRFDRRVTWLDRETFVPLRTEHRRGGALRLVARTLETREIQGVPTPVRMQFESEREGRRVTLEVEKVDYDAEIPEEYFSTLALIRASVASGAPRAE